jgi:hypothetical protein
MSGRVGQSLARAALQALRILFLLVCITNPRQPREFHVQINTFVAKSVATEFEFAGN